MSIVRQVLTKTVPENTNLKVRRGAFDSVHPLKQKVSVAEAVAKFNGELSNTGGAAQIVLGSLINASSLVLASVVRSDVEAWLCDGLAAARAACTADLVTGSRIDVKMQKLGTGTCWVQKGVPVTECSRKLMSWQESTAAMQVEVKGATVDLVSGPTQYGPSGQVWEDDGSCDCPKLQELVLSPWDDDSRIQGICRDNPDVRSSR